MKQVKLYNVIFPFWFLLFFPPVILVTLAGNFLIDSGVLLACYFVYRLADWQVELKSFYKQSILKVWFFGFLADIIGAAFLFITGILGERWGIPYEISSAINFDPFSHPLAVLIIITATLISALLIFWFNYRVTFKNLIKEQQLRFKAAVTIALITAPWTFLLPTKWFYY
ncbi:MAG TPA: hypothetical protein GXX46_06370 [Peptococcaceae bacterium]|nr:hypothetical protein [Peptococcaceae bacterium]